MCHTCALPLVLDPFSPPPPNITSWDRISEHMAAFNVRWGGGEEGEIGQKMLPPTRVNQHVCCGNCTVRDTELHAVIRKMSIASCVAVIFTAQHMGC